MRRAKACEVCNIDYRKTEQAEYNAHRVYRVHGSEQQPENTAARPSIPGKTQKTGVIL